MSLAVVMPLWAHDPGLSSVRIHHVHGAVIVEAAFANIDFAAATTIDRNHDGRIGSDELATAAPGLLLLIGREFVLRGAGGERTAQSLRANLAENRDVELTLTYAATDGDGDEALELSFLKRMARGHRCYVAAFGPVDSILRDALLSPEERTFPLPGQGQAVVASQGFGQSAHFYLLGIEHILLGFDHLAFLLALLVAGGTRRSLLATITAFTVAHSLTLASAALGLVRLPAMSVEVAIAGSIVWVACENLLRGRRAAPHRWPLAFGFGLVHGFGFANVLADLHVGGAEFLAPLVTFNLGVETGQLMFAAVVLPLLAVSIRGSRAKWFPAVVSAGVGIAGLFWLWQRLGA